MGAQDFTEEAFDAFLADSSKEVVGDLVWETSRRLPRVAGFRVEVRSTELHPVSVIGRFNPKAHKLSYTMVYAGVGRIYGLDLGVDHRNPDGVLVGSTHKHAWTTDFQDRCAYVPSDITEPWNRPIEVWRQFCNQARLRHTGVMHPPTVPGELWL